MRKLRIFHWSDLLDCVVLFCCLSFVFCETCTKLSSCKCQTDDGGIIDLSPLASSDGTPRYKDVHDSNGNDYFSFNPCYAFTEGYCQNVAFCQIQKADGSSYSSYYSIGTQDSVSFSTDDQGRIQLVASDTQHGVTRTSYLSLVCDQDKEGTNGLQAEGEKSTANYYFTLTSKYACPVGGGGGGGGDNGGNAVGQKGGMSDGSALIVVVLILLPAYLVGGALIMKFVKGKSGTDVIPNKEFWMDVPYLIKDGFMFTVRGCKNPPSYNNL